jgi:glucose/arabinose dehydrogenase
MRRQTAAKTTPEIMSLRWSKNPLVRTAVALLAAALALSAPAATHAAGGVSVPSGFIIEAIAHVKGPRELAVAPNGDLFIGTNGSSIEIVAGAQDAPAPPAVFVHVDDRPVAGVTIDGDTMYLGAQFGVYALPFHSGDRVARAAPRKIAAVRPSGVARDHVTTTVAVAGGKLYASVGSSCNDCQPDIDPTRATIQEMRLDGSAMTPRAEHIRNAIALTTDPATGALWAGVAGQDELAHGHPYEIVDDVSAHSGVADYGWPYCYEDRQPASPAHDCAHAVVPRIALPAYETPIGAAFYPRASPGAYLFPAPYRGGLFVALHGSWHLPPVPPRVVFIAMHGDEPQTAVNWADPAAQWREFAGGFQTPDGSRIGRPTGVAIGTDGSLFVADDGSNTIYRIRPIRR